MINVSLNELMVGNELPAPRIASRSEASAFAALLDHTASSRDAVASDTARDHSTPVRDAARPSAATTTDIDQATGQTVPERSTRGTAQASRAGERRGGSIETTSTDAPDAAANSAPTETDDTANASAGSASTATNDDADGTDDSATADGTNAAAILPTPIAPLSGDVALLVAPGPAPQNLNSLETPPKTSSILPDMAAQNVSAAPEPKGAPVLPQLGDDGQASLPTPGTAASVVPVAAPTTAGNTFSETLFAATLAAQPAATDNAIMLPASFKPQTATVTRSLTAAPAAGQPISDELPLEGARTVDQPAKSVPVAPAAHDAALQTNQPAARLGTLLDLQNVDIDIAQLDEFASGKSLPPLANGMVAQIGLLQPADKPIASFSPTTPSFGAADSLSAGNTPTQTATAVIAPPVAQAVADEPRAKIAPDQDGMVVNAPGPAGAAHISQSTAVDHASPAKFTLPTPPATDQVAVHIAKAAADGADKINIKLKPVSLGQIEVQLDVSPDGRVHAVIAADKPETLDLLQRDARGLERALNDAGLRTDSGSLSFNLRGQNQQFGGMSGNAGSGGGFGSAPDRAVPDMELLGNASRIGAYLNSRAAAGGVDIQV